MQFSKETYCISGGSAAACAVVGGVVTSMLGCGLLCCLAWTWLGVIVGALLGQLIGTVCERSTYSNISI